jgi:hypothetical protein
LEVASGNATRQQVYEAGKHNKAVLDAYLKDMS